MNLGPKIYARMTLLEREYVCERFFEIMQRAKSNHIGRYTRQESHAKFDELYEDAREWVSNRRLAA